jgi:hypothetical protein
VYSVVCRYAIVLGACTHMDINMLWDLGLGAARNVSRHTVSSDTDGITDWLEVLWDNFG